MNDDPVLGHLSVRDLDYIARRAPSYLSYFENSENPALECMRVRTEITEEERHSGRCKQNVAVKKVHMFRVAKTIISPSRAEGFKEALWIVSLTYREVFGDDFDHFDTVQTANLKYEDSWQYKTVKFKTEKPEVQISIDALMDWTDEDRMRRREKAPSSMILENNAASEVVPFKGKTETQKMNEIACELEGVKGIIQHLERVTATLNNWARSGLDATTLLSCDMGCVNYDISPRVPNAKIRELAEAGLALSDLRLALSCPECGEPLIRIDPAYPTRSRDALAY